jgi:hypothetical protein
MTEPNTPLRGDDAWRAARDEIAKRNDAVHARAARERTDRDAAVMAKRRQDEKREMDNLPQQPHPL